MYFAIAFYRLPAHPLVCLHLMVSIEATNIRAILYITISQLLIHVLVYSWNRHTG